jgi:hypothetical protein
MQLAGQSDERGLRSWMKVFWFFFSKKNRKKALLFEKRSKNFYPFAPKHRNFVHPIALMQLRSLRRRKHPAEPARDPTERP